MPQLPASPAPALDALIEPPAASPAAALAANGRFASGGSLRERAARGSLVSTAFLIGLSGLGLLKSFILAGFLTRADYGVWGVLVASLGMIVWLKQVGIGDKYIQQDDEDQELAFQRAFTLELIVTGAIVVLMLVAIPIIVLVYDLPQIVVPGLLVAGTLMVSALQAPLWIFYRRMQFARQRAIQAVDPAVGFVVSIVLAVAGAGYWAFVVGFVAGVCASAAVGVLCSPFALRLRFERRTLRSYVAFSWPLLVAGGSSLVMVQSAVFVTQTHLGLAATGVIALAGSISSFTDRVDELVTGTLYPAICAIQDRAALLHESFVKSNRLALMWAVPFGIALTLFCSDLVGFGIGERWRPAVGVLEIYGVTAAVNHIGFNWTAYLRARSQTRPIAVANAAAAAAFLLVGIPLLLRFGLLGFAWGIAIQGLVALAFRAWYLQRLFQGFGFLRHALRSFLPTLPAAAIVLGLRAVEQGHRTVGVAVAELAVYALVTVAATWTFESDLLREAAGYLTAGRPARQGA